MKKDKNIISTEGNSKVILNDPCDPTADTKTIGSDFDVEKIKRSEILDQIEAIDANNEEILAKEVVKEKLEEVASKTAPGKKLKSTITSILFLAINIALVYLLASNLMDGSGESTLLGLVEAQGTRLYYLWWAVACFVIVTIADTLFISLILKMTTKKFRLPLSYKVSSIGKYYEAITPFAAGGQPAQIVYLSKNKVSPGVATSVPIIRVTLINFATIFVSLFLFVFRVPNITGGNSLIDILIGLLEILAYIGLIINTLYLIAVIIIANSKVVGRTLARTIVRVGYKLRIVKDYRSAYKKIINQVEEYRSSIDYLKRHDVALFVSVLLVIVEILALASIPFFVTLGLTDVTFASSGAMVQFWTECLVKYYICYFASTYIPLPGGTGMMEIAFVILFSSIIGPSFVAWGFLLWRFISYYSTIVQGFFITIYDVFKGLFRKEKLKHQGN